MYFAEPKVEFWIFLVSFLNKSEFLLVPSERKLVVSDLQDML